MNSPAPQSRLKTRQQEWLVLALLTALATIVYELWPELDLRVSSLFFAQGAFQGSQWAWPHWLYLGMPIVGGALSALALLTIAAALLGRRLGKKWVAPAHLRRAVFGLLVVVLGVGLLVHTGLKDNWGRARPADVQTFGGSKTYNAPLRPADQCARNCSFVSGHAAGGFAVMAIGMLGSRRSRWRWWSAGMVAGGLVGLARMVEGRHFLGDIVFGGLLIWAVCLLLRDVWIRLALRQRRAIKR
ncbi:MAG: phosphatase PAP2 family protein [Betaproteobacteria bacterium]